MNMTATAARRTRHANVVLLHPVASLRTNRFGAYAPVVHPFGAEAPATATGASPAFATPDEAVSYAHGLGLTVLDAYEPDDAA